MKNNRNLRAFSLIEVSIVVLIIGILIAGITQSSRLLAQAKVNTAKSLTQSSPIPSISGLSFWIEASLDESFTASQTDDGSTLTKWNDNNPQVSTKSHLEGTGIYRSNGINGIPAVEFNGTAHYFDTSNFPNISTGRSTVFAVVKTAETPAAGTILSKPSADVTDPINIQLSASATKWQFCDGREATATACALESTTTFNANQAYIISSVYVFDSAASEDSTTTGFHFFKNGVLDGNIATTSVANSGTGVIPSAAADGKLAIGASGITTTAGFFKGTIGEIAIYDRALKQEERQAVEEYLSKKWGINVTPATL